MPQPVIGKVIGHRQWTDTLFSIQIDAPILPFEAGQFGRIGLMMDGKPIMRPYSFVNAPDENPLEFYYVIVPGGPLSPILPTLNKNDEILVNEKSNGFLVLSEVPDANQLWMLATGTALGPFLSILKTESVWQRFKNIVLIHAVRLAAELAYRDDINLFIEKGKGQLQYIPFVSREQTDYAVHGRIPRALEDGTLNKITQLSFSPDNAQFMICGNPQMVKDTIATLETFDFKRNRRRNPGHITVENYW